MPIYNPILFWINKAGSLIGKRKRINFIEGTNVTINVTDNPTTKAIDVEINSTTDTSGFQTLIPSPIDGDIAITDATGQTQDSGKSFSTDGTLGSNSDALIPTEKAVKTYSDTKIPLTYLDTDVTLSANSDSRIATQKATKAYVDASKVGIWNDRGNFDASGGAYPSSGGSGIGGAILKGNIWTISVPGTLPTGQVVEAGDTVRALVDSPTNTQADWAIQQNNIGYTAENSANKSTDGTFAANSDTFYPSQKAAKTYADTKIPLSYLDTDGTLAANSDSKVATQKATKTYVDNKVFTIDNMPEEVELAVVNSMRNSSVIY